MKQDFFSKRAILVSSFLLVFALLAVAVISYFMGGTTELTVGQTYYLLLAGEYADEQTAQVFSYQEYLSGGSGYVYTEGDKSYAVLSCYFTESDARSVQEKLKKTQMETTIQPLYCSVFHLRSLADHADAETLSKSVSLLLGFQQTLYQVANGLERLEYTQGTAKSLLSEVAVATASCRKESKGVRYEAVEALADGLRSELEQLCKRILTARDVRYIFVQLCVDFCRLQEVYS